MNWQPTARLPQLQARAAMNDKIRGFFKARGVMEVETPALSQAGNTDPAIHSFSVNDGTKPRWLHTSPEYPMKRLLAAGSGDIYQLCKVWRQKESGSRHNPEFTLLEWYRVGFSLEPLLQEVDALLHQLIPDLGPSQFIPYRQLFLENLGIDPHIATEALLSRCAKQQGITFKGELDVQGWLDLLLTHCLEPHFPADRLTYVYDYPASQSALAQLHEVEGYQVAKRCEMYLGNLELGNAYQELIDPVLNRQILQQDAQQHAQAIAMDEHFLQAMQAGMPATSGIAMGVDRFLLAQQNHKVLSDIIAFSWEVA